MYTHEIAGLIGLGERKHKSTQPAGVGHELGIEGLDAFVERDSPAACIGDQFLNPGGQDALLLVDVEHFGEGDGQLSALLRYDVAALQQPVSDLDPSDV